MKITFATDEKIAETSSKGNQEKWFDKENGRWYKVDQFGYEALAETLISRLLCYSNIKTDTPFDFVEYRMERLNVHKRDRTGCSSANFLTNGQSIITLSHLLNRSLGGKLKDKLLTLSSDKKRISYIADATAERTGLNDFGKYLTLLFEIDSLFLNDDRHLNNIAVLENKGKYSYCPIFDNGAGLLSNVQFSPMNIDPGGLIPTLCARPFNMSFTRQMNSARNTYGKQLNIKKFTNKEIAEELQPLLAFYAERDRGIITDRVMTCIKSRQGVHFKR